MRNPMRCVALAWARAAVICGVRKAISSSENVRISFKCVDFAALPRSNRSPDFSLVWMPRKTSPTVVSDSLMGCDAWKELSETGSRKTDPMEVS